MTPTSHTITATPADRWIGCALDTAQIKLVPRFVRQELEHGVDVMRSLIAENDRLRGENEAIESVRAMLSADYGLLLSAHNGLQADKETLRADLSRLRAELANAQLGTSYWLIERNQLHGEPEARWFSERKCFAQGDQDLWVADVNRAERFKTKELAERSIEKRFTNDERYPVLPIATDHIDVALAYTGTDPDEHKGEAT